MHINRKNKNKAFTMIECLMITLVIAILVLISAPNMLRARMMANDSSAKATLRTLAEAAKMYKLNTGGQYPTNVALLLNSSNGYIKENYCGTTENGFTFSCSFSSNTFTFRADPVNAGVSGTTTYTITTGGVLMP